MGRNYIDKTNGNSMKQDLSKPFTDGVQKDEELIYDTTDKTLYMPLNVKILFIGYLIIMISIVIFLIYTRLM